MLIALLGLAIITAAAALSDKIYTLLIAIADAVAV